MNISWGCLAGIVSRAVVTILALNALGFPASVWASTDSRLPSIRVAVYDFELDNIPIGVGEIVTDSLLSEIRKLEGISAIGMREIEQMLSHEAQKEMMGCDESESCLSEIAGALGVDELITGKISEAFDGRILTLRRIDQLQGQVVSAVNQRLVLGNGEEFLAAIGPAIQKIYPKRDVRPGETRGVPPEVGLKLNPPPVPVWATGSVVGAAALSAAVGGVFGYMAMRKEKSFADPTPECMVGGECSGAYYRVLKEEGEFYTAAANTSYLGASVLSLSGLVMSFFTDWDGHGAGGERVP